MNDYKEFAGLIDEIVSRIVDEKLSKSNIYVSHTGTITKIDSATNPYLQKCSVDLVFTTLDNIINKSGELLKVNDTVTIMENYNSKLSNCYISIKNG